jgi:polyhydroxybutyrate depolymerase
MSKPAALALAAALVGLCACSSETMEDDTSGSGASGAGGATTAATTATGGGDGGSGGGGLPSTTLGGDRPTELIVPSSYDPSVPTPLVILLHGYSASGFVQDSYFGLSKIAEERGFLYAHPDGTVDAHGLHFWNATDACCDFGKTGVDDSAYLRGLVEEAQSRFNVDPKRIYFLGHSNGGFMSFRMACDHADLVAGIASLAGAMPLDPPLCDPVAPVHVLAIHGDADDTIFYEGADIGGAGYPSAQESVDQWVALDGCDTTPDATAPNMDLVGDVAGAETSVIRYEAGCQPGGEVELWTMVGAGHVPNLSAEFSPSVIDYLLSHPKP